MTPEEQQVLNAYLMHQQEEMLRQERERRLYKERWDRTHDGIVDTETEDLESEMDANPYNDEYRFTGPAYDDEPER